MRSMLLQTQPADFKSAVIEWSRVFLVKGWFKDTLTQELVKRYCLRKASLIMVDCDLHSSTVDCLRFVAPLIAEQAIVVFDDWSSYNMAERNLGEARAFREFLECHPEFEATELGGYNDNSLVFSLVRRRSTQRPYVGGTRKPPA